MYAIIRSYALCIHENQIEHQLQSFYSAWNPAYGCWIQTEIVWIRNLRFANHLICSSLNYIHVLCVDLLYFVCLVSSFQHLNNLLEYYLEPLKRETFLSNAEITALFGNIQEIFTFQRQFLQNLEEALELEPDFHRFEHSSQFKVSFLIRSHWFLLFQFGFLLFFPSFRSREHHHEQRDGDDWQNWKSFRCRAEMCYNCTICIVVELKFDRARALSPFANIFPQFTPNVIRRWLLQFSMPYTI